VLTLDLGASTLVSGLAPATYYWQAKVQKAEGDTPAGRYDADGGTWWRFTVPDTAVQPLTITVVNTGGATGRVRLTDGFECWGVCTAAYPAGLSVETWGLPTHNDNVVAMLVGWSGACSGQAFRQVPAMTEPRACTATFAPAPAATKVAPADNSEVANGAVLLEWSPVDGAGYNVCVADAPIERQEHRRREGGCLADGLA
jgi:hypothetical protein